jgi:hypothetical protein
MKARYRFYSQASHWFAGLLLASILGLCVESVSGAEEAVTINTNFGGDLNELSPSYNFPLRLQQSPYIFFPCADPHGFPSVKFF